MNRSARVVNKSLPPRMADGFPSSADGHPPSADGFFTTPFASNGLKARLVVLVVLVVKRV